MPSYIKLAPALLSACLAGLLAAYIWSFKVGIAVFSALLAGGVIGYLSSSRKSEAKERTPDITGSGQAAVEKNPSAESPIQAGALLNATMNGMREGVLVVDQAMRVVAFNSAARDIFSNNGMLTERARLSELTRTPAVHTAFRSVLESDQPSEVKVELQTSERRVFDLRVVPLHFDGDNGSGGAIGVFFDITRLERLERVRQEFFSNVSHELRTPLTSIMAFVETLEEGAIDDAENSRHFLSIISKNAARMNNLINDILELSAIEAGTVSVEKKRLRLHTMVSDIASALSAKADSRGVVVRNEISPDVFVHADARKLEQMLTNLIDNAIKFNRSEGVVTVAHERGERDRIMVTDTGEGIPAEHLPRIFERFYRVDRARSRAMGGTGLGLAIVKHLARAHNGEVGVQSTLNQGSTFTIELPAEEESVASVA